MSAFSEAYRRCRRSVLAGSRIAAARLRFFLLLGGVVVLVASWPTLRNYWDKLTTPGGLGAGVSPDTEYWCPMCPGVASEWPGKCPVCHMALVVRQKGDMTPLPDGVVARMQFSPYRVQLAGIHTSPVAYRRLIREIVLAGLAAPASADSDDLSRLILTATVFENDVGLLHVGQHADVTSEAFPGQDFAAHVLSIAPRVAAMARSVAVRLEVDNPRLELRQGMFITARVRVPLAQLPESQQRALDAWSYRTAIRVCDASLASPVGAAPGSGLDALLEAAVERAAALHGLLLAIPESAVIDTGARTVVFVEQAAGLFDAVEVRLGRRSGDFYPVLAGLKPGQAVVTAGSFLLDAETRLNPAAAASYFGAGSRGGSLSATPMAPSLPTDLSADDQLLVKRQKVCPVTDQPLGSMGTPFRMVVAGRTVFLCCSGCAPALKKNPTKYLAKLPQ